MKGMIKTLGIFTITGMCSILGTLLGIMAFSPESVTIGKTNEESK